MKAAVFLRVKSCVLPVSELLKAKLFLNFRYKVNTFFQNLKTDTETLEG